MVSPSQPPSHLAHRMMAAQRAAAQRAVAPRHRRPLWIVLPLVALLFLATSGVLGLYFWTRPLGPALLHAQPASLPAAPAPIEPPPNSVEAGPEPLCGGPAVMTLLIIGSDSRYSGDYTSSHAAADVIRLARIDFTAPSAALLVIPRDLWVSIPGMAAYGVAENRIKTAYTYGNQYLELGGGPSLLVQTLEQNFGLTADHYVAVNFEAFEQGIDALGGIDVNVPEAVDTFPAGRQHMDGETALRYARLRPGNASDLARIDRQTQLIAAIQEALYRPEVLQTIPQLITLLRDSALTDLSPAAINQLVCIGRAIPAGGITMIELPAEMTTPVIDEFGYEQLMPDYEAIRALAVQFQSGQPMRGTDNP